MTDNQSVDSRLLTVELLSAYLRNNIVSSKDLCDLIRSTRFVLNQNQALPAPRNGPTGFSPAVSPRKSLASDQFIISLIDGKNYKSLKRHLSRHGLTPETYRARFGLPATYPMVAPALAQRRREIAKAIGLGTHRKTGPE